MFKGREKLSLIVWISSAAGSAAFQVALAEGQLKDYHWLGECLWFVSGISFVIWLIFRRTFLNGAIGRTKMGDMPSSDMQSKVSSDVWDSHANASQAFDDSSNPAPGAPAALAQTEEKPETDLVLVSDVAVKIIFVSNQQSPKNEAPKTRENAEKRMEVPKDTVKTRKKTKRKNAERDIS